MKEVIYVGFVGIVVKIGIVDVWDESAVSRWAIRIL